MQSPVNEQHDASLASLGMLWRRRRMLALCIFVLAFAAAVSFIYSLPDIYRATATIQINPGVSGDQGAEPSASADNDNLLDAVSESVMSRSRLIDLINRYGLYSDLRRYKSMDTVLARMRDDIQLERLTSQDQWGQGRTYAFTLSYQGWDPEIVGRVANTLAASYVEENSRIRARRATETTDSLSAQIAQIKQKLDSQAQAVNAFENSHLGELPQQEAANLAALQQLNTQLQQSISNEMLTEERSSAVSVDTRSADLPQLEQELAALRTRYTEKYPDVVRLEGQIAALKRAQANHPGTAGKKDSAPPQIGGGGTFADDQKRLRAEIADYQQRINNIPLRSQQLQALTQGYNETQEVYSSLVKRYEQARLDQQSQGAAGGGYRIMELAHTPADATGPSRLRLLLMALVLCLGVTAAAVVIAEQLDTSFHKLDELRLFTRVPVLATIPKIVTTGDIWRRRLRLGTVALTLAAVLCIVAGVSHFIAAGNERVVWMLSRHHS